MEQCWAPDPAQRPAFTEIAGRLRAMSVAANQAKGANKKRMQVRDPILGPNS